MLGKELTDYIHMHTAQSLPPGEKPAGKILEHAFEYYCSTGDWDAFFLAKNSFAEIWPRLEQKLDGFLGARSFVLVKKEMDPERSSLCFKHKSKTGPMFERIFFWIYPGSLVNCWLSKQAKSPEIIQKQFFYACGEKGFQIRTPSHQIVKEPEIAALVWDFLTWIAKEIKAPVTVCDELGTYAPFFSYDPANDVWRYKFDGRAEEEYPF